jgi:hypothetical protein
MRVHIQHRGWSPPDILIDVNNGVVHRFGCFERESADEPLCVIESDVPGTVLKDVTHCPWCGALLSEIKRKEQA